MRPPRYTKKGIFQMSRRIASLWGTFFLLGLMAGQLNAQDKPPVPVHDLAGKDNCLMCHTAGVMEPVPDVPATHEGRNSEVCLWCHAADSPMQTGGAKAITHDLEGKDNCLMCHAAGVMPPVTDVPESHEGRTIEKCQWCHKTEG